MIKPRDSRVTEERILKAALEEFGESGLSGARVDRIAERAGVNKAMIYYHFSSKEVLYERVIKNNTSMIFTRLKEAASESDDPVAKLQSLLTNYMSTIDSIDRNVIKTILRELASGGKFFIKIALPNLIFPMMSIAETLFTEGLKQKKFKSLNPYYSFMQMVGGILFFNMIKIPLEDSPLKERFFSGNYLEEFRKNYLAIALTGILEKEG